MPTLKVKPGISLFYLDSGAPDASDNSDPYMTVFTIHGLTFHSPIFNQAIAVSTKHNIRLVAITRRDYPGSSSLTTEDVKDILEGPTEKRLRALANRAEEILLFIEEFISINSVPLISPNEGGFSLLGWSLGNQQGLSVLAFANLFPDLVEKLTPYFRSYILYELVVFFPLPLDAYHPLTDESIPKEELGQYFIAWMSSYFLHPVEGIASGDATLLNQNTLSTTKPSSTSQFTPEDYATMLDYKPAFRADVLFYELDQEVNIGTLERTFSQQDSQSQIAWPNAPVRSLWGDETTWSVIYNQWELKRWIERLREGKSERWFRTHETYTVSGDNHFLHWDEPDKFIEAVKHLML